MNEKFVLRRDVLAFAAAMSIAGAASAETYSFFEPFNAPPLAAGTEANFYTNGWNNGNNGWIVSEAFAAQWGQRTGVSGIWPGGTDNAVGTIRHQDSEANSSVSRSFGALAATPKPLSSGNITLNMQNILVYGSNTELTLYNHDERIPALTLRFGENGIGQNSLQVSQVGGNGTVVTSASSNLPWSATSFTSTTGHYGRLSIDFNAALDQATVTVSSINASGVVTSATPVVVPFENAVDSIGRMRLKSYASPNPGNPGSLLWLGDLSLSGEVTAMSPTAFGKNWVRNNEFQIMGTMVGTDPVLNFTDYMNAGMTTVFANNNYDVAEAAAEANLPWMMHLAPPRPYEPYTPGHHIDINNVIDKGNAIGWMLHDEPVTQSEITALAQSSQWFKENHPELPVIVSVFQNDAPTLNNIIGTIKPDIVIFDYYPFNTDPGVTDDNQWFQTLTAVRTAAKAANIPYWGWMQSFQAPGNPNRVPSESDVRYNAFTLLTAGYTGLNYFTYDNDTGGNSNSTFFNANDTKSPFYFHAQALNSEVAKIGKSLRFLESNDVRFIPGTVGSTPTGLTNWSAGAGGDTNLLSVAVDTSEVANQGVDKEGMIGFSTDDDGDLYFMLTNLYHHGNLSAAATSLDFVLTFTNDIDAIYRLSRLTGAPERVDVVGGTLNLTLPGGTGDLFKYDDGYFPSILPGDADLDGDVDLSDLSTLAASYGAQTAGTWLTGDFDLDGDIDLSDLSTLAANYGAGSAQAFADFQAMAVPEPGALSLLAIPLLGAMGSRNVRRRADQRANEADHA